MRRLTVLVGPGWPEGRDPQIWPGREPTYVPLEVIDRGSPAALARFPTLPPPAENEAVTVVADDGRLWSGGAAWIALLWATRRHRAYALARARDGAWHEARRLGWRLAVHGGEAQSDARKRCRGFGGLTLASVPWLIAIGASMASGSAVVTLSLGAVFIAVLLAGDTLLGASGMFVALVLANTSTLPSGLALGALAASIVGLLVLASSDGRRPDARGQPRRIGA